MTDCQLQQVKPDQFAGYASGSKVNLVSGKLFDVFDPDPQLFDIGEIARTLANICRFGGRIPTFYSVAQHSVYVLDVVRQVRAADWMTCRAALFHDASEAYLGDIPRPIKRAIPELGEIDQRLQSDIFRWLGIDESKIYHDLIKLADAMVLQAEAKVLAENYESWNWQRCVPADLPTFTGVWDAMLPQDAESMFLKAVQRCERGDHAGS